ncbi:NCS1 family transporter [Pseudodonghicola xiamenensis]|uniref:Nitrate reductase n=1 Tax=Pseudodonghicola xiamenensis TaxID=337702 RepID=A0A8J3HBA2_9RHOB|nr:NCS1 family transporter [Pseudodonghicola xiamenensis]GHG98097.1 nitrate reductase [Pseudodonghicola xiamenensis]
MTMARKAGDFSPGRTALVEEALLPTTLEQRSIGLWGYAWIFIGIAVIIATYSLGAAGIGGGIGLGTVILTILAANVVIGVVMTLTADIGTEHGLSFAVYLRAPFGVHGTHLPSISRGVVASLWFGIQTYLGALAINGISEYFLGFDNWPVWYVLFTIVQVINTALGIRAVEKLAALAAPAIIAISVWMYFTLDGVAQTKGVNIWTFRGAGEMSLAVLFITNMGFWSTLAIDIPNLTRFVKAVPGEARFLRRNRNIFLAQLVALPVTQALIAGIGAISFIAAGNWNPVEVIQDQGQGLTLVVLLVLVVLAQWSTNNSANLIPAALTFVNLAPRLVNYRLGVVLAGIVGALCFPWLILNNLFVFLGYYGAFLSAIGGIVIADYYVLRRRRVDVPGLYDPDGPFRYTAGFNLPALAVWLVAGAVAAWFVSYAFVIGLPLGFVLYLIVMRRGDQVGALATTENLSWVHTGGGRFERRASATSTEREDQ